MKIEVNARMPRNGWLAVACGVNFPWIIYQDLVNNRQVYVKDYPVGLYWIELYPDLYSTVLSRHIEKLGVHDFLSPYTAKQKSFAVLNTRDPMPFLKHSATIVRRLSQGRTG